MNVNAPVYYSWIRNDMFTELMKLEQKQNYVQVKVSVLLGGMNHG